MSEANPVSTVSAGDGCGAPAGGFSVSAATGSQGAQSVVEGHVTREGAPVSTGYARLVLAPNGLRAEQSVQADHGHVTKVEVSL